MSDFDAPRAHTNDPEPDDINDQREADLAVRAQAGLLRNSAVMATGSIVSRLTGILRNIALTAAVGLTISADAFALGRSLPDIIYCDRRGAQRHLRAADRAPDEGRRRRRQGVHRLADLVDRRPAAGHHGDLGGAGSPRRGHLRHQCLHQRADRPGGRLCAVLSAPDLLLRAVHDAVAGTQRPRTVRHADVRPHLQQPGGHRHLRVVRGRVRDRRRRRRTARRDPCSGGWASAPHWGSWRRR